MKPAFEVYDMKFMAADKPVTGKPKHDLYRVNQVLESYKPKNGHHKAVTTRPLTDAEKDIIKERFLKMGGILKEDATKIIKKGIPDVTIFQIVGAINGLHRQVQKGIIQVKDPLKYNQKIEAKRQTWATWNSPKYQALRNKINGLIPSITKVSSGIKIARPRGRPPYFAPSSIAFAYPSMGV